MAATIADCDQTAAPSGLGPPFARPRGVHPYIIRVPYRWRDVAVPRPDSCPKFFLWEVREDILSSDKFLWCGVLLWKKKNGVASCSETGIAALREALGFFRSLSQDQIIGINFQAGSPLLVCGCGFHVDFDIVSQRSHEIEQTLQRISSHVPTQHFG
jgi:hypothetical protein